MQISDEIKSKIDIVEFIGEYISVQRAGSNFRALCPFHNEKTPSFMISPEKQIWHCFGCGKGGDIFSFLMEMEGLSFVEALRVLAPKAGVVLRAQNPEMTSKRNRILDILDLSRKFYHRSLLESPLAKSARVYLKNRGLSDEVIEEWQIGYSPDSWDDLINFLKSRGFTDKEIFLSGMSVQKTGQNRFYNRFRGRIMFPINDANANTVAFTARVSPEKEAQEKMGKYINSPQSLVYDKSKILFGLDKAKTQIKKQDFTILMEGQMDVITAHQFGFRNVVASSGTALTTEQVKTLKRYSSNIALAFDADSAGQMASERAIREAMAEDMNIKIIEVPNGKDPDECIRKDLPAWKNALKKSKQVMQYYFDKNLSKLDLSNIDNKRKATQIILPIIARLKNKMERDFWLREFSQKIDVDEHILRETLHRFLNKDKTKKVQSVQAPIKKQKKNREEQVLDLAFSLLFKFPFLFDYFVANFEEDWILDKDLKKLYINLIFYYNNEREKSLNQDLKNILDYKHFKAWLKEKTKTNNTDFSQNQIDLFDTLSLLGDKEFDGFDENSAKEELARMILFLKKIKLLKKKKSLEKQIADIEKTDLPRQEKELKISELFTKLKILSEELNAQNQNK